MWHSPRGNIRILASIGFAFVSCALTAYGQQVPPPGNDLHSLREAYAQAVKSIETESQPGVDAAKTKYVEALTQLESQLLNSKKVDQLVAIKAEIKRVQEDKFIDEDVHALPADLRSLRLQFEQNVKDATSRSDLKRRGIRTQYVQQLDAQARALTAQGKASEAQQIRVEEMLLGVTEQISQRRVTRTPFLGGKGGTFHEDLPRPAAVLSGLHLGMGQDGRIKSLQPIYRNGEGDFDGNHFGEGERASVLLAKPGYAVGAILLKPSDRVYGIQVTFMRILTSSNTLDQNDSYKSEWLGGNGGGGSKLQSLNGAGHLIVGVGVRSAVDVDAVGLIVLQ